MPDVFLSFCPADRAAAARVAATIESAGATVVSAWSPASPSEARTPARAADTCRVVIVLWSRHGIADADVLADARAARATGRLLPILIEQVVPPAEFRDLAAGDFTSWRDPPGEAPGASRLRDTILHRLADSVPAARPGRMRVGSAPARGLLAGIGHAIRAVLAPVFGRDTGRRGRDAGVRSPREIGRSGRPGHSAGPAPEPGTAAPPAAAPAPSPPGAAPGHPSPAPAGPDPGIAPPRAVPATEPGAEPVLLGVAAPRTARPGDRFTAHFAAYVAAAREAVRDKLEALGDVDDRIVLDLAPDSDARWRVGAPITVRATCDHASVVPAERRFDWNGRENLAGFVVHVDAEAPAGTVSLAFHVCLAGVPIAFIPLRVAIGAGATAGTASRAEVAAPASAFASYASADTQAVARSLSTLAHWSPRLDIFQDCLDLTPNEAYKPQLAAQIAARDVFLLFWSRNAAASRWVAWEYETARASPGVDAILPIPLEDPSIATPPPELADRHLRDRFMIAGYALRRIAEIRANSAA